MSKSNKYLNYSEFTASVSPALQALSQTLAKQPRTPGGVASQPWQGLQSVVQSTSQAYVDYFVTSTQPTLDQVEEQVTQAINQALSATQTTVTSTTGGILDPIEDLINAIREWLDGILDSVGGWIQDAIGTVNDLIGDVHEWIDDQINAASGWIVTTVNNTINGVKTWLQTSINNVADWLTDTYNNIRSSINAVVGNVGEWLSGVYSNVSDWIVGALQSVQDAYITVKETIEDKIQDILNWIETAKQNIVAWWHGILQNVSDFIYETVIPNWNKLVTGANTIVTTARQVWDLIQAGNFQGALDAIDKLFTGAGLPAPVKALSGIVSVIAYFWETIHLQFVALEYNAQKQAQINLALEPLDLSSATQAVYKGLMSTGEFIDNARLGGISRGKANIVVDANRPLPTPGQIQDSFLRGEISLKEHDQLLSQYGMSNDNIQLIKQLYLLIPGVSDLIRMAVREAFTPEIAEKFGQYEDLPTQFVEWGMKQGLSEEWCGRYWAAHWDLPSPQMGFEMLHRGVISNDELTLLLRALDVMPFWRERLIKISYNPLTRVDVRRMYSLGILTADQVKRAYLDLGYDEQRAEWLKQFTIRYYTPEDDNEQEQFKGLARTVYSQAFKKHIISEDEYRSFLINLKYYEDDVSMLVEIDKFSMYQADKLFDLQGYRKDWQTVILKAYDRGLLHRNEVTPILLDLGYSDEEATMELDLSDYNRTLTIRNMVAQQVHDQYITYIIDVPGLHTLLDIFNFTSEEINRLQEEWDIERSLRTKHPALSDLKTFFKQGIINLDELLDELRGEGYNEKYIPMYAQSLAKGKV